MSDMSTPSKPARRPRAASSTPSKPSRKASANNTRRRITKAAKSNAMASQDDPFASAGYSNLPPLRRNPNIDPRLFDPYDPHPEAPAWSAAVDIKQDRLRLPPPLPRPDRPATPPPHPRTISHNTTPSGTPPPDFETGVHEWRLTFWNPTAAKYTITIKAGFLWFFSEAMEFRHVTEFDLKPGEGHHFRATRVCAYEWWQTRSKAAPLYVIKAESYTAMTDEVKSVEASVNFDATKFTHAWVEIGLVADKPELTTTLGTHPDQMYS